MLLQLITFCQGDHFPNNIFPAETAKTQRTFEFKFTNAKGILVSLGHFIPEKSNKKPKGKIIFLIEIHKTVDEVTLVIADSTSLSLVEDTRPYRAGVRINLQNR